MTQTHILRTQATGKWLFRLFLGYFVAKQVLYAIVIPPWQGYDEANHFEYVAALAASPPGTLATTSDKGIQQRIIGSLNDFYFWELSELPPGRPGASTFAEVSSVQPAPSFVGQRPPLYYFVVSLPLRFLGIESILSQLYVARLASIVFGLLTIILIYRCAGIVFVGKERTWFAIGTAAFAGCHPQFSYFSSVVNSDGLAILVTTTAGLVLLGAIRKGFGPGRLTAVFLLTVLALVTKSSALITVPLVVVAYFIGERPGLSIPRVATRTFFLSGLLVLLLMAFFTVVGAYHLEALLQMSQRTAGITKHFVSSVSQVFMVPTFEQFRSLSIVFVSFWFSYGQMVFKMTPGWYLFLGLLSLFSLLGLIRILNPLMRKREGLDTDLRSVYFLLAFLILALLGILARFGTASPEVQGRHLFVALPAISILFTLGICGAVPVRYRQLALQCLATFMLFLNALSFFGYLVPIFYLTHYPGG